ETLVEPHALAVIVIIAVRGRDAVRAAYVDSDVFAHVRPGHHGFDIGIGRDDDAHRPQSRRDRARREQHAQLVSVLGAAAAAARFARGRTVVRSRVKNETSASGSAPASAPELLAMPADWASIFCALKAGMFADSSETVSDRLPATRMKGRTRTISRLPLARV